MSQVSDVGGGAARPIKSKQPPSLPDMSDGELADEHRGQGFAKRRAEERLRAVEAELDRRGLTEATGKIGVVTRHTSTMGLIDLRRLRQDHPDLCRRYAEEGSDGGYWRAATLPEEARGRDA